MEILINHWGISPHQLRKNSEGLYYSQLKNKNHEKKKINQKKKVNGKLPEQIKKQIQT